MRPIRIIAPPGCLLNPVEPAPTTCNGPVTSEVGGAAVWLALSKGGRGATEGFDGWDHIAPVVCLGGLRSPDPELHEIIDPFFTLQYEYTPDSAGPGRWRGGLGVTYRFRVDADDLSWVNFGSGVRDETAPFGLEGGGSAPNRFPADRDDRCRSGVHENGERRP